MNCPATELRSIKMNFYLINPDAEHRGILLIKCNDWVEAILESGVYVREGKWTQSIAIGTQKFVENTKQKLGIRAKGRKVVEAGSIYQLREPQVSYPANLDLENDDIGAENTCFWEVY